MSDPKPDWPYLRFFLYILQARRVTRDRCIVVGVAYEIIFDLIVEITVHMYPSITSLNRLTVLLRASCACAFIDKVIVICTTRAFIHALGATITAVLELVARPSIN